MWTSARDKYPLTDLGRRQAAEAAKSLADAEVRAVYTSGILRARQTGAVMASRLDVPLRQLEGLEELHVGVHEEGHDDEVAPVAAGVFRGWLGEGNLDHGFEGGETGTDVVRRFSAALGQIAARHPEQLVVAVSHGGVLAVGLSVLCDNLSPRFVATHLLGNGERVDVVATSEGWHCASWAGRPPA